jgi:sec-independent protein translocase protein TatC
MTPGVGFTPALYPHERKAISPFLSAFTILLVIGVVFVYEVLAPFILWGMIPFFILTSALPIITAMGFYNLVFIATLVSGFSFTMPTFFVLLVRFGIIKTSYVTARRRYIYAALYIICAIVTPEGGPLADTALFVPIAVLMEVALFLGRRSEKWHVAQPLLATTEKEVHGKCR